jgi:hypothetical protein
VNYTIFTIIIKIQECCTMKMNWSDVAPKRLDELVSKQFAKLYSKYPNINNELFNKNKLTPVITRELTLFV